MLPEHSPPVGIPRCNVNKQMPHHECARCQVALSSARRSCTTLITQGSLDSTPAPTSIGEIEDRNRKPLAPSPQSGKRFSIAARQCQVRYRFFFSTLLYSFSDAIQSNGTAELELASKFGGAETIRGDLESLVGGGPLLSDGQREIESWRREIGVFQLFTGSV